MKLKLDDAGKVVVQDGKPVYVDDQGKEFAYDLAALQSNNARLLEESKGFKTRLQQAEDKLKAFEGIDDPDVARKAIETVKNLDEGQLVTAGKVEEIKKNAQTAAEASVAAAKKQYEKTIADLTGERDKFKGQLHQEKIGNAFSRSKFVSEKIAIPVDILQAQFGARFSVDDNGRIIAKGGDGQPIISAGKSGSNYGDPADFEEAIEAIVGGYANKDQILKAPNGGGSGADTNNQNRAQPGKSGALTGTATERQESIGKMFPDLPA